MIDESCCTCATLLENVQPIYNEKTEKPIAFDRRLDCCSRVICGNCQGDNPRFMTYCPFCQVSTIPTSLPQGLRDPPSYPSPSGSNPKTSADPPAYAACEPLPPYSSINNPEIPLEKSTQTGQLAEDVLHFLDHQNDTLPSLSFRYNVPIGVLRRANNITSDHLLLARRTIMIPGEFYKEGVSLSPRPIEGEEEERRKGMVRRWMVACKVAEYDVALLYLKQVDYDLEAAIEAYKEDERWEKEHPIQANIKGKGKGHDVGRRRFTGQRSKDV